jgi:type IV pilus assembly protein PilE
VSLIELLTVMVIIGILSSIAIPAYRAYVIRANRTDAKTSLMFYAGALERCYTRNNSYDPAGAGCNVSLPRLSDNGYYQITVSPTPPTTTFTLTAAPQGAQTSDTGCGSFTLTSTNGRGISGGTKTAQECWGK